MTNTAQATALQTDWHRLSLAELIQHIECEHHAFLEAAMPRLRQKLVEVIQLDCGRNRSLLSELAQVLITMSCELHQHLMKEEDVLFPFIISLETAANRNKPRPYTPFGEIGNPIHMMESEHDDVLSASIRIRELLGRLAPAKECQIAIQEFKDQLTRFDQDINLHTHLENDILFPKARALEAKFH